MKYLPYIYPALMVFMLPLISDCYAYNGLNNYYSDDERTWLAGW